MYILTIKLDTPIFNCTKIANQVIIYPLTHHTSKKIKKIMSRQTIA